jgi:arylsulfatase A
LFEGKPVVRRSPLFWHYFRGADRGKAAIRDGDWKLIGHWDGPELPPGAGLHPGDVATIKHAELTDFELYNIRDDPAETRDLARQEPRRVEAMAVTLRAMYANVLAEGAAWEFPPSSNGPEAKKKGE